MLELKSSDRVTIEMSRGQAHIVGLDLGLAIVFLEKRGGSLIVIESLIELQQRLQLAVNDWKDMEKDAKS